MSAARPAGQVVLLCGPSGSGKSRLAARLHAHSGWPIVRLDDFYKDGDDESLPMLPLGLPDWDDVRSWDGDRAAAALERLCREGATDLPLYDLGASRVTGHARMDRGDAPVVVAEGIFAAHLIGPLESEGLLRDALCVCHHRNVTFVRRLSRDLREHRKPPLVLWRRGLLLRRQEEELVRAQSRLGARPMRPHEAFTALTR